MKVLILGGTAEGRQLAERLAAQPAYDSVLSFAGRTSSLVLPQLAHRVGGFGGAEGLARYLMEQGIDALVDTTHPFAARISHNAVQAAAETGVALVRLARPAWRAQPGDDFREVASMEAAAAALGSAPKRVFLSVGRLELAAFQSAPQHYYLVRAIDPFPLLLAKARLITARGPFALAGEQALLEREGIELLVSKNSGSDATYAKIEAARQLRIPVVMVQRPWLPPALELSSLQEIEAYLAQLHARSSLRGV